ncbi:hypothetical protein K469DRAFT_692776 [Zopfia rhizophila CBS 207.26]|uniref:Uncharacterized protein n=1 Tax=Zopfia rhizophila CBS 207.26 TaxID=1314779 RepID=A0A6A6DM77_9PEZI|nr:hypothetical protein K469DRAFT_692776 [Zopfia rhizophila CBS 207.26]
MAHFSIMEDTDQESLKDLQAARSCTKRLPSQIVFMNGGEGVPLNTPSFLFPSSSSLRQLFRAAFLLLSSAQNVKTKSTQKPSNDPSLEVKRPMIGVGLYRVERRLSEEVEERKKEFGGVVAVEEGGGGGEERGGGGNKEAEGWMRKLEKEESFVRELRWKYRKEGMGLYYEAKVGRPNVILAGISP